MIGAGVGPFSDCFLDETFGFSVGARSVGPGEAMLDALLEEHGAAVCVAVTGAVVGEHATDGEAEA